MILGAYLLLSLRKIASTALSYQLVNVIGALAVGISSVTEKAFPAAALNFSWTLVGLYALFALRREQKHSGAPSVEDPAH